MFKKLLLALSILLGVTTNAPSTLLVDGVPASGGCVVPSVPGITGLIGWYDASVFSSMTFSGTDVLTLADQSCSGNDTAPIINRPTYQATGLNSRPAWDFNGGSAGFVKNNFAFGTGNTLTVFFVGQFTTLFSTAYGRAISYSAGPGYTGVFGTTTDQDNNYSFSLGQEGTGNNVVLYRNASIANRSFPGDGTPHRCIATIKSDGVMTIYVDGVATVGNTLNTAFASTPSQFQIGNVSSTTSNAHWHGQLSEVGVATGYSDATAVGLLDTYLKNKWGL